MARLSTDDIFRWIFVNEKLCILISLKFVPRGPIEKSPALFQIMAPNRRQATIFTSADLIH